MVELLAAPRRAVWIFEVGVVTRQLAVMAVGILVELAVGCRGRGWRKGTAVNFLRGASRREEKKKMPC